MSPRELQQVRRLLCRLQDAIRDTLVAARAAQTTGELAKVAAMTAADTIYQIDRVSEAAVVAWFEANWPARWPVELVMEGVEEGGAVTFPRHTPVGKTVLKCILDPIDGTRNLMYDKRSAWVLAAVAPQRGNRTHLGDIVVAAMSELPTSKQWAADQVSGVKGCGLRGLVAERVDLRGGRCRLRLRPSQAADFKHGFASLARFFPEGKALLARVEEEIWDALYGLGGPAPLVFDDQYIASGGQVYELLAGHDRMLGDLRPLAYRKLGFPAALVCHPYDICTAMLLQEAGGVVETPEGAPLRAPLDTTSAVAWMGYANPGLARQVRPLLKRLLKEYFG
jgi:fructose-1,6-bisphosphatase/inositol monophosphatase family enzyme